MNRKLISKIVLDIVMTITFIMLMDAFGTGLLFHEIAGLSIMGLFILHLVLNWSWVKGITQKLFSPQLKISAKLKYVLNMSLFLCCSMIIITGVMISEVLFPSSITKSEGLYIIHKWTSYFCLGLFSVHIAIHGSYLVRSFGKIRDHFQQTNGRKAFVRLGAVSLIIILLYTRVISTHPVIISSQNKENMEEASGSELYVPQTTQKGNPNSNKNRRELPSSVSANDKDTSESALKDTTSTEKTVSLAEYLSNLHCDGCHKHCSLLYPQCNVADPLIEAAKVDYQNLYGDKS